MTHIYEVKDRDIVNEPVSEERIHELVNLVVGEVKTEGVAALCIFETDGLRTVMSEGGRIPSGPMNLISAVAAGINGHIFSQQDVDILIQLAKKVDAELQKQDKAGILKPN